MFAVTTIRTVLYSRLHSTVQFLYDTNMLLNGKAVLFRSATRPEKPVSQFESTVSTALYRFHMPTELWVLHCVVDCTVAGVRYRRETCEPTNFLKLSTRSRQI